MRSSQKWYRLVNGPKYGTGYSEKSSYVGFDLERCCSRYGLGTLRLVLLGVLRDECLNILRKRNDLLEWSKEWCMLIMGWAYKWQATEFRSVQLSRWVCSLLCYSLDVESIHCFLSLIHFPPLAEKREGLFFTVLLNRRIILLGRISGWFSEGDPINRILNYSFDVLNWELLNIP